MARSLFGRAFGGKPPAIGKYTPGKKSEDGDQDDTDAIDDEEEDDATPPVEVEEDDDTTTTADDEDEDEEGEVAQARLAERSEWTEVMSSFELPPNAVAAVEALGTGKGAVAAFRAAMQAPGASALDTLARKRGSHAKAPRAGGGAGAEKVGRKDRIAAGLDRALGRKSA